MFAWHVSRKGLAVMGVVLSAIAGCALLFPSNQVPVVSIVTPVDGATFPQGQAVTFAGTADDSEDGALSGASLVWLSSIDGQLGTGQSVIRNDLSVGAHAITLIAPTGH